MKTALWPWSLPGCAHCFVQSSLPRAAAAGPSQSPRCRSFLASLTLFRRQERPAKQISEARYFPRALPRVGPPRGKALARRRKSSIQRVRVECWTADPFLILSLLSLRFNGQWPFSPPPRLYTSHLCPPSVLPRLSRAWAKSRSFLDLAPEGCLIFWGCGQEPTLNSAEIWSFSSCLGV